MLHPIIELPKQLKSNIAVFLGSGSSVNDITEKQWEKLKKFDLWAVNNWVYHPFIVPDVYGIELKGYDWQIVKDRLDEKWEQYKHVNYITVNPAAKKIRWSIVDAIGHPEESKVFIYEYTERGLHPKKNPGGIIDANYPVNSTRYVKSYDASLSLIIDMMYKFNYKYIILVGVDMSNGLYFWTNGDKKIYGKTHCQTNKDHEGQSPKAPHNAHHMSDFIIDFNRRHCLPHGKEIFIQTKKSLLYPHLRHIEI